MSVIEAALGDLLFSQSKRLLVLDTPLGRDALLAERFSGREGVNEIGGFQIDCLSLDAHLDLQPLIGQEVRLQVCGAGLRADADRGWHGIVTAASALGADGGFARYRLQLQPWLALLGRRRDSFIYQDKTALQIIEEIFSDYTLAAWRLEVGAPLKVRSLCTQYNETDLQFVQRLLREEGLNFHVEQVEPKRGNNERTTFRHTLVISDDRAAHADLGTLPFARAEIRTRWGATQGITAWSPRRRARINQASVSAWDYRQLNGIAATSASARPQGEIDRLEFYDGSGAYRHDTAAAAERRAALIVASEELERKVFDAASAVREVAPASTFKISGRTAASLGALADAATGPRSEAPAFRVVSVEHEAANNLGAQAATLLARPDTEAGTYRNRFTAVPAAARLVPPYAGRILKPTAPGAQTAIVVAAPSQPQSTDRELRVRVQFPWQRGTAALPGGLTHDSTFDRQGNAPGDDRSGTWIRVAQPSAGTNWGSVFVPRVGTEVLVSFVEGDIDRPVITGQLFNGTDTPPLAAGVDSGVNHPGVISGFTVPTLDQAQLNQWVLDDATGQLRMRMASSYALAEVGLGHLIAQGRSAERGAWLGSGFLLHSGAWSQLRAGAGLLLSATARTSTDGASIHSTALDGKEALAHLRAAHALGQHLSDSARAQKAAPAASHDDGAAWHRMLDDLAPGLQSGEQPEPMAGPLVALDTPATAAWISEASTAVFSGQDLSVVTQGDSHASAAQTVGAVAGGTVSVYTHAGGIAATAGQGPVSLRAHTDTLEILSDDALSITSADDSVRVQASTKVQLTAGGACITLEGANITFACPGAFTVKAATHAWEGPGGEVGVPPHLPTGRLTVPPETVQFRMAYHDGAAMPGAAYKATLSDGSTRSGVLDSAGYTQLSGVPAGEVRFDVGPDPRPYQGFKLPAVADDDMITWMGA